MENIDPFEYRMPKEFSRGVESKVNLSGKKKKEKNYEMVIYTFKKICMHYDAIFISNSREELE